jgi:hypothetical protein
MLSLFADSTTDEWDDSEPQDAKAIQLRPKKNRFIFFIITIIFFKICSGEKTTLHMGKITHPSPNHQLFKHLLLRKHA